MIRFAFPLVLWTGLALVVVMTALYLRFERRRARVLTAFAGGLAPRLARAEDDGQRHLRWGLRLVGLLALAIAAAGPRWGEEVVRISSRGSDLVFVFDTSKSMDVRDVPPSRLEEARREALALLEAAAGDRIGVVAFAGDAAALSPLTVDHSAARLLIESLTTDVVDTPGSDVGRGLRAALRVLPEEDAGQQAIVLFTDGEDLEGGVDAAVEAVVRRGVRVFAVGVGTPGGQTIPLLDERGYQTGVKLGPDGEPVVSRLDAPAMRTLARRTRGQYFAAPHPGGEIVRLRAALAGVGEGAREGRLGARPVERFPWFAFAAWILMVASWLLPERRTLAVFASRRSNGRAVRAPRSVGPGAAATLLVACGLAVHPIGAHAAHPLVEGNRLYAAGDFRGAVRVYEAALRRSPGDPALATNLGAALYRLGDMKGAEESFARAQGARDRTVAARAGHGRGNSLFRQERYREALDAYRAALEARPDDAAARFNYELTLRKLRPDDKPPEPDPQQPPPAPGAGGGGGGGGGSAGNPSPQQPGPANPAAGPAPPQDGRGAQGGGPLSAGEAARILDALQDGERQAMARRARGRGVDSPKERDW